MKTLIEQIQSAKRAYIVPLNARHTRFQVYLDNEDGEGLKVLWGDSELHEGKKQSPLWAGHTISSRAGQDVPSCHFHLTGDGYSKTDEIARELRGYNPEITVGILSGFCS